MLSGWLFGQCVQPLYWQPSLSGAAACGLRNGLMYAVLASLLGVAIYAGHKWKVSWMVPRSTGTTQSSSSSFPMIEVLMVYVITVWAVLPILFRVSAIQQWQGYQVSIEQLMDTYGMSRLEAINVVQGWHSGELSAGATSVISGAALLSTAHNSAKCVKEPDPSP